MAGAAILSFASGVGILFFKKMKIFGMGWEVDDNFLPITQWKKRVLFIWLWDKLNKNLTHTGETATKITLLISLRHLVHSLIFLYMSILRPQSKLKLSLTIHLPVVSYSYKFILPLCESYTSYMHGKNVIFLWIIKPRDIWWPKLNFSGHQDRVP